MNIRKIFDQRRFSGCDNPRAYFPYFKKGAQSGLSVNCVMEEGGACLKVSDGEMMLNWKDMSLPPHIGERIEFWERWVNDALEFEYEQVYSAYGLEVYALSIAIDLAIHFPDKYVNYCGLVLHDDYAIYDYIRDNSIVSYTDPNSAHKLKDKSRPLDKSEKTNPHIEELLRGEPQGKEGSARDKDVRYLTRDVDWGYRDIYLTPLGGAEEWGGAPGSCDIDAPDFPKWLENKVWQISEMMDDDMFWGICSEVSNSVWFPSPLFHVLWVDSIIIDIARYISPPCRISFRKGFIVGDDVLRYNVNNV